MAKYQREINEEGCTKYHADQLARAALLGMENTAIDGITTVDDVLCASFMVLDKVLGAHKRLQASEDAAANAKEIGKVLQELILQYATVVN